MKADLQKRSVFLVVSFPFCPVRAIFKGNQQKEIVTLQGGIGKMHEHMQEESDPPSAQVSLSPTWCICFFWSSCCFVWG